MSNIHFEATLNADKLEASIKQSNKTVGDWAKNVEKAGATVDKGLEKTSKSFKDAIKEQKDLIKSIEKDIKQLEKDFESAGAGKQKKAVWGDLQGAKKALAEEQATLLGLQKQQIEANSKEESSQSKIIGSLSKWALGLATVGTAMKITKSIIAATETTTHAYERVVAQATSGVGYFFKAIGSGDWSNFSEGLSKAIKGAGEFVDKMEELRNRQNEQKIKSSELDKEIGALRDKTYDRSDANNFERLKSLDLIIAKEKEKYTAEAKIAEDEYKITLRKAATDSGLSERQIESFVKEYSSLQKMLELGEEYNKLKKKLSDAALNKNAFALPEIKAAMDAMGPAAEKAGKYVTQIGKVTEETRKQIADQAAAANEAAAAFDTKNRRDKLQAAQLRNEIMQKWFDEIEDQKKEAEKDLDINHRLEDQQKLMAKALEDGNIKEANAIAKRIALLKTEIELREKIAANAILVSQLGDVDKGRVKTTGLDYVPGSVLSDKFKNQFGKDEFGKPRTGLADIDKINKRIAQDNKNIDEDEKERLKEQLRLRQELVGAAMELYETLSDVAGLDDEMNQLVSTLGKVIEQYTSGDQIGAAITYIVFVIKTAIKGMTVDAQEFFDSAIKNADEIMATYGRIIAMSERTGMPKTTIQSKGNRSWVEQNAYVTEIAKMKIALEEAEKWEAYIERHANTKKGFAQLEDAKKKVEELKNAIEDASYAYQDFLLGGLQEGGIADMIAQGFSEGKTSIDDFANYLDEVLKPAILEIFKMQYLLPEINKTFTPLLKEVMADNKITPEESDKLAKTAKEIADKYRGVWNDLTSGIDFTGTEKGLSGAIQRSITEETGSELAGLFRRFADDERLVRDYSKMGVDHLIGIEKNTFDTVVRLDLAVKELQAINSNTKKTFAGEL